MMSLKCSEEGSWGEENFIWFKMLEYRKKAPRELYDQTEGSSASARLQAKTQAYNHTWNSPLSDQCMIMSCTYQNFVFKIWKFSECGWLCGGWSYDALASLLATQFNCNLALYPEYSRPNQQLPGILFRKYLGADAPFTVNPINICTFTHFFNSQQILQTWQI